jgi:hypothetical protein
MVIGAFGFLFSTYGKGHAPANVRLTLFSDNGRQLALTPELTMNEISDDRWVFFKFPSKVPFPKGGYSLMLSLVDYSGPDPLSAWATKTTGNAGDYLEINGVRSNTSLKLKIEYYEKTDPALYAPKWDLIDMEKNIMIFENRQVTGSVYFVRTLDPANDQLVFSGVNVMRPSSDLIEITYSKGEPGWIVLPMHLHPGWKAYIDDRRVSYDTYLGMLPAIPVQGACHILFRYQPESFRKGLAVSAAGVSIFLVFFGLCLRYAKKKP